MAVIPVDKGQHEPGQRRWVTVCPIKDQKRQDDEKSEVVKDASVLAADGRLNFVRQSTSDHGQADEHSNLENIGEGDAACAYGFDGSTYISSEVEYCKPGRQTCHGPR